MSDQRGYIQLHSIFRIGSQDIAAHSGYDQKIFEKFKLRLMYINFIHFSKIAWRKSYLAVSYYILGCNVKYRNPLRK